MQDNYQEQIRRLSTLNSGLALEISILKKRIRLIETKPYVKIKQENERMKKYILKMSETLKAWTRRNGLSVD